MKSNKLLFTLAILSSSLIATSCGKKGDTFKNYFITFHQDGVQDFKVEIKKDTTIGDVKVLEPNIEKKTGYDASWEDYSLSGVNTTVNVVYTPTVYHVNFIAQGSLVESVPFTINDITGTNSKLSNEKTPAVPEFSWGEAYWEDYSLSLNDLSVYAKYDHLSTFVATFSVEGVQLHSTVSFTKNDLTSEGKLPLSMIPEEVKNYPAPEHKNIIWDFTISEGGNTNIEALTPWHAYKLKFVDFDGEQVGDLVEYTYPQTWQQVNKPDPIELEGYQTGWEETTLERSEEPQVVHPTKVGNKYHVSFAGIDVTQEVTMGEPYTLNQSSDVLEKWFDEDEKIVPETGVWNYPGDKILHKKETFVEGFESTDISKMIDVSKCMNISSVEVVEGEGINHSNAVKATVNENSDFGIKIKQSYLDDLFAKTEVQSFTFVARGSRRTNNFRHKTANKNICYEINDKKFGLETYYKKFSFTREMYASHLDETDFVIYGGIPDGGSCNGLEVYIDSFIFNEKSVFEDINEKLSFECGSTEMGDGKANNYTPYDNSGSLTSDMFFIQYNAAAVQVTNVGHSNKFVTDGISSFTFTKSNGYIALFLGKEFTKRIEESASRKISFDIYSTVHVNSNASVGNATDGQNKLFTNQGGKIAENAWTTFVLEAGTNITSSNDNGRFLIIQGSSAGTFYIDNIHILPAE